MSLALGNIPKTFLILVRPEFRLKIGFFWMILLGILVSLGGNFLGKLSVGGIIGLIVVVLGTVSVSLLVMISFLSSIESGVVIASSKVN